MQTRAATFFVRTRPRLPNHDGWHSLPRCPGTFLRAERETSSPCVGSEACLGGAPPAFVADSSVGVGARERLGLLVLEGRGGRCQPRLRTRGGGGERGDGARCGVPSTEGGLGGRRTSGCCSFVFSTRHVLCRISVLVHHASISGAGVVCGVGAGVRGEWDGTGGSSACAVTRSSTSLRAH